ncbi:MAG: 50S ribosomal protein L24 [PS1 clade bacterium]|uniref:Large ribosomal subunit protein uL24 n=1 Tax=PS1 clade bacterium TaxID=2175152 RepID=A0A937HM93_9PROT|nr:50S ribosomal protein L24 [PS1 clade bacterium]
MKIKKGDKVVVTTGRDKGKSGDVLAVFPSENRAIVQGVNMVKRHQKQTAQSEGGIINREGKIHISNLAIADPKDGSASRIGYKLNDDGTKSRIAKRSGEVIDG